MTHKLLPCFRCGVLMRPTRWVQGEVVAEGYRCRPCGYNLLTKTEGDKLAKTTTPVVVQETAVGSAPVGVEAASHEAGQLQQAREVGDD